KHPADATVEALRQALTGDKFWGVRAAAAEALAKRHEPAAKSAIVAAIAAEKSGRARHRMVESLGRFRRDRGLIPELKKIADPGALGKNLDDKIGRKKIRERLIEMIDDPQFRTRSAAMGALGTLADPLALPALRAAQTRMWDGRQRQDAVDAIEEINDRDKEE